MDTDKDESSRSERSDTEKPDPCPKMLAIKIDRLSASLVDRLSQRKSGFSNMVADEDRKQKERLSSSDEDEDDSDSDYGSKRKTRSLRQKRTQRDEKEARGDSLRKTRRLKINYEEKSESDEGSLSDSGRTRGRVIRKGRRSTMKPRTKSKRYNSENESESSESNISKSQRKVLKNRSKPNLSKIENIKSVTKPLEGKNSKKKSSSELNSSESGEDSDYHARVSSRKSSRKGKSAGGKRKERKSIINDSSSSTESSTKANSEVDTKKLRLRKTSNKTGKRSINILNTRSKSERKSLKANSSENDSASSVDNKKPKKLEPLKKSKRQTIEVDRESILSDSYEEKFHTNSAILPSKFELKMAKQNKIKNSISKKNKISNEEESATNESTDSEKDSSSFRSEKTKDGKIGKGNSKSKMYGNGENCSSESSKSDKVFTQDDKSIQKDVETKSAKRDSDMTDIGSAEENKSSKSSSSGKDFSPSSKSEPKKSREVEIEKKKSEITKTDGSVRDSHSDSSSSDIYFNVSRKGKTTNFKQDEDTTEMAKEHVKIDSELKNNLSEGCNSEKDSITSFASEADRKVTKDKDEMHKMKNKIDSDMEVNYSDSGHSEKMSSSSHKIKTSKAKLRNPETKKPKQKPIEYSSSETNDSVKDSSLCNKSTHTKRKEDKSKNEKVRLDSVGNKNISSESSHSENDARLSRKLLSKTGKEKYETKKLTSIKGDIESASSGPHLSKSEDDSDSCHKSVAEKRKLSKTKGEGRNKSGDEVQSTESSSSEENTHSTRKKRSAKHKMAPTKSKKPNRIQSEEEDNFTASEDSDRDSKDRKTATTKKSNQKKADIVKSDESSKNTNTGISKSTLRKTTKGVSTSKPDKHKSKKKNDSSESNSSKDDSGSDDKAESINRERKANERNQSPSSSDGEKTKSKIDLSKNKEDIESLKRKYSLREVKIMIKKLNPKKIAAHGEEKRVRSSSETNSDETNSESKISGGNSESDYDRKVKVKRDMRKRIKKSNLVSTRHKKTRLERKRSCSISVDEDGYECRRSSRQNKFVFKKRKTEEDDNVQAKKKKRSYESDDDYSTTESSSTNNDDSDPDYGSAKKKTKNHSKKSSKSDKYLPNGSSSSEEDNGNSSPNESDEEFDRLMRDSSPTNSDDSSHPKVIKERRSKMKLALTITGNGKINAFKEHHQQFCRYCKGGGELVCCLSCSWSYHLYCLDPPVSELPPGSWECPRCVAEPLRGKVSKIFSWRWEDKTKSKIWKSLTEDQQKSMKKPKREYFIHWTGESFWKCSWVSEFRLSLFHNHLMMWFLKDDRNGDLELDEGAMILDEADPLYERFYRNGVKPQWLNIHRIISIRQKEGKTQYLVKWCGLSYNHLSWENENDEEIPDFDKFKAIYHEWRMIFTGDPGSKIGQQLTREQSDSFEFKYITKPPKRVTTDIEEDYESQPPFIDKERELQLHDYQLESLNWLRKSWNSEVNTILADEMGLGKTIQAIMFIYSLFKEGHSRGPFLVTAPLSTIVNWEREFELWAPDLYVVTYSGVLDERVMIREHEFSYKRGDCGSSKEVKKVRGTLKFHVLLTSYEFMGIDIKCLSSIRWAVMIVDEAHRLKNTLSKFFTDLHEYSADYKLLLTGTPLQNNLQELLNILLFLCPEKKRKLSVIQEEFDDTEVSDSVHKRRVSKLQSMLKPHMLRRVKESVLKDLPTKSEIIVKVQLSPMQEKYYKFILTKNFSKLNSRLGGHWATLMLVMADLQKCCNHPYLFSTAMLEAPVTEDEIYETKALVEASGKLSLLQKMLHKLKDSGHRVLIFSHFTRMLDILQDFLDGEGYTYKRIDGNVVGSERQTAIDGFNAPESEYFIFLLSTKAGGLGINLATADTVILYDSDYNPHSDIQAFSRAHRIGQTKTVMIYRFITRNSIEERIAEIARKKLMLNHIILESGRGPSGYALSKNAVDQIIRHGTLELFKEGRNVRDNFTDEAVDELLDRSKQAIDKKENLDDDPLSSVKVVSYVTKDDEEVVDKEEDFTQMSAKEYWGKLLRHLGNEDQKVPTEPLGKRVTKRINYKDTATRITKEGTSDSDSKDSNSEEQNSGSENSNSEEQNSGSENSNSDPSGSDTASKKTTAQKKPVYSSKYYEKKSKNGEIVLECKLCGIEVEGEKSTKSHKLNCVGVISKHNFDFNYKEFMKTVVIPPISSFTPQKVEAVQSENIITKSKGKGKGAIKEASKSVEDEEKKYGLRKKHPIWQHFVNLIYNPVGRLVKADCKYCGRNTSARRFSLLRHLKICSKLRATNRDSPES